MNSAELVKTQGFFAGPISTKLQPCKLSGLDDDQKRELWAALQAENPEAAQQLQQGLKAARQFFPSAELEVKGRDIERYLLKGH